MRKGRSAKWSQIKAPVLLELLRAQTSQLWPGKCWGPGTIPLSHVPPHHHHLPSAAAGEEPWGRRQLPVLQCQALFIWIHNNNSFTRELACLSRLCQVYVPDGPCLPHLIYWRADQLHLSPGQAHIWQLVGKISPHDTCTLKSYFPEQFSFCQGFYMPYF